MPSTRRWSAIPARCRVKTWGFYDIAFGGKEFQFERPFGSYVMENVLFKISFPAEFHAQTAVECAMQLHPQVKDRIGEIEKIVIETQEAGVRIIDKTGPLANYADRDHCLQYMVAVPLIFGRLTADDYNDDVAADPRIDALREQDGRWSRIRSSPRTISTPTSAISAIRSRCSSRTAVRPTRSRSIIPIGHRKRRAEGIPVLMAKCEAALRAHLPADQVDRLMALAADPAALDALPVSDFIQLISDNNAEVAEV